MYQQFQKGEIYSTQAKIKICIVAMMRIVMRRLSFRIVVVIGFHLMYERTLRTLLMKY
jgi:hypothetical protein